MSDTPDFSRPRERASDWLAIGPLVGFTDQRSARIIAKPYTKDRGQLHLRIAKAHGDAKWKHEYQAFGPVELAQPLTAWPPTREGDHDTLIFDLEKLEPDTRYFYEVSPVSAPDHRSGFASEHPFSFRTWPKDLEQVEFSFHSCNGVHKPPRNGRSDSMWQQLVSELLGQQQVHFAVLGGDQVYADSIRDKWLRRWYPEIDLEDENFSRTYEARRCREYLEDLPRRYERIYRAFWRRPEIRTFMGHIPCVATWDDHDIYDGWGSHGDEHLAPQQRFYQAASKAFDAFQHSLNPRGTFNPRSAENRSTHRAFSFMAGKVAFLVLDSRSGRNIKTRGESAVLGDEQWRWLELEIQGLTERPPAERPRQIVVVTAVPVVHMSGVGEHAVPDVFGLDDDLLDHWGSRPNRNDQGRLLGTLFQLRKQLGANVLILGGDVHVGTVGSISSDEPRFLLDGERQARLHQGVSSSIAYKSTTGAPGWLLRKLILGEHSLRGSFTGRIEEVIATRNFARVTAQANSAFRFTLFGEDRDMPDRYYFGFQPQQDRSSIEAADPETTRA
jgi:phosphodiesterase/alkaline phosphatase D-like protein